MPENINCNNNKVKEEVEEERKETPGLLPPHALPTPPPPPPLEQDSSSLTSPWWSEEEPTIETKVDPSGSVSTSTATNTTETGTTNTAATDPKKNMLNISFLAFSRASTKENPIPWKERCYLLAKTEFITSKKEDKFSIKTEEKRGGQSLQKELEELMDSSKECSMICFLRSSRQLTKDRLLNENDGKLPITFSINPFYGTWLSVAETPARCKEHLLDAKNMKKKNFADYYTVELGEELSNSGQHVTKVVKKTFGPLQHLTQKYIDSWKDGNQQAFFSKFWTSAQKGDAFYLVLDSTKRLFENALGHDKKK